MRPSLCAARRKKSGIFDRGKRERSEIPLPRRGRDGNGNGVIIQASEAFQFDTIDDVLHDIAAGKMVIVTDDADRENEGDLIMAAEKATPASDQFHDDARARADLRPALERARRSTRVAAHGRAKPGNVPDRFHRLGRRGEGSDDRDQRARSRGDHPHHRSAEIRA